MKRLDRTQSPIVDRTLQKRQSLRGAKRALSWSLINIIVALTLYLEVTYGQLAKYFSSLTHPFFWYAEWSLAVLFTLNAVVDLLRYLKPSLSSATVELTPRQKRLLGVQDSDAGFSLTTRKSPSTTSPAASLVFSPSSFSSHSSLASTSTPLGSPHYSHGGSPRFTPPSRTPSPSHHLVSPGHHSLGSSTSFAHASGSFISQSHSGNASRSASFSRSGTSSPLSPGSNLSPLFHDSLQDNSGLRSRFNNSSARSSPLATEDCMTDVRVFENYLREQNEKEYRGHLGSPETNASTGPSFWSYNRTLTDFAPVLRKYQYQIACRSPQSTKSHDSDPDDPATFRGDEIWQKIGIHRDELDSCVENLRKWLSQTIMVRVVSEMASINKKLTRIGCEDMRIGEVAISTLKQVAVTKAVHVPTLNAIVPYLEICPNQEYLVQRIKELGTGGCMPDFKWNSGGDFKGKPWGENLPSDCEIVMHMLCTYMDSRLPPHPKYPNGKTFTSQHFVKTPDKPDLTKKDQAAIFQSKMRPPHYKVILGDETWDVPRGRNNMFHALLLFLFHIYDKEHGMLGRVNLRLSGINILWVLNRS